MSNADRTIWFLQRAYARTEEFVAAFVREVYLVPRAPYEDELLSEPFFDPSHFFLTDPTILPSELVHFIYHNYPTDSYTLAEAAVTDLSEGRAERAEQLLAVGAIPSLAPAALKDAAAHAEIKNVPGVSTRYPSERMMAWKNRDVERKVCVCGFDAGAAALRMFTGTVLAETRTRDAGAGGGDDTPVPAEAVALLLRKIGDRRAQLGTEWDDLLPPAEGQDRRPFIEMDEESERVMDRISFGPCQTIKYWMMPFNGTVGKYSHPLSEAEKAFSIRASRCPHEDSLTREFLAAYVLDLRRRLL